MTLNVKNSIVDYLKSQNKSSDFQSRSILYQEQGFDITLGSYSGTSQQNKALLNRMVSLDNAQPQNETTESVLNIPSGETPKTEGAYTIKSGDTLSAIAATNNTTVDALMAANPQITNPDVIYAGDKLNISGGGQTIQPGGQAGGQEGVVDGQEGDIRFNPGTGNYELFDPAGNWRPVTEENALAQQQAGGRWVGGKEWQNQAGEKQSSAFIPGTGWTPTNEPQIATSNVTENVAGTEIGGGINLSQFDLGDLGTDYTSEDLSNAIGSPTTESDIQELIDKNQELRQQVVDSMQKSPEELQIETDLVDIRSRATAEQIGYRGGVADIQSELVSTRLMAGKETELATQVELKLQTLAMQESNLISRLEIEQGKREEEQKVSLVLMGFNQDDIDMAYKMQKAVSDEKQQMFDNVMKLQDKSRDLLTDIMNNFDGFDMDDLSSTDQSYLVNLAADGGIPASILWQALHANKSSYLLTQAKKQADLTQKLQDSSDVESWADAENWVKDNSDKSYDEAYLYLSQHFDKILDNSDKKALLKRYGISTEEEGATFDETKIGIKLDVEMYQNNGYTREEAGTSVGISLKDALGVEKKGELPQVYSDAIEEALDAAYGSAASGKGGVWNLDYFKTMLKSTLFPGLSTSGKNE